MYVLDGSVWFRRQPRLLVAPRGRPDTRDKWQSSVVRCPGTLCTFNLVANVVNIIFHNSPVLETGITEIVPMKTITQCISCIQVVKVDWRTWLKDCFENHQGYVNVKVTLTLCFNFIVKLIGIEMPECRFTTGYTSVSLPKSFTSSFFPLFYHRTSVINVWDVRRSIILTWLI